MRTAKKKLSAAHLFNCSDLTDFVASIVQILPYKGASQSRFYLCEYNGTKFLTKLCFYRKNPPEIYKALSDKVVSQPDAEINILQIFKERFIDTNITPCILELVYAKTCDSIIKITPSARNCERLLLDYRDTQPEEDLPHLLCQYSELVKSGLAHDKCAFLVLDRCDLSLDEYLRKSINTPISFAVFKSLLFQIIYAMYVIQKVYPKFHHYDLHTDNVLLKFDVNYKFKANDLKFLIYTINDERSAVPYFGIIPKIIDFGLSALPEEGIVSNATEDQVQMYNRSENDLLLLFHWIQSGVSFAESDKSKYIDKLLQRLEPNRLYVQYYPELIRRMADKIPTYEQMIKNPVWNEYKKTKPLKSQIYNEFTPVEDVFKDLQK